MLGGKKLALINLIIGFLIGFVVAYWIHLIELRKKKRTCKEIEQEVKKEVLERSFKY